MGITVMLTFGRETGYKLGPCGEVAPEYVLNSNGLLAKYEEEKL